MAPLALVDDIVESFRSCPGFAPYTFVAYAYSAAIATGAWERPGITLSLRFDPDGPSSWIRVHGSPRSRWHRQVVGHLVHTGYAIKHRFHDETVCQRWLRGKRELSAELRFLERFGPDPVDALAITSTKLRAPTRPHEAPPRSPPLEEALQSVRTAAVPWSEWSIGVNRRRPLARGCTLVVSVIGNEDADERWIETCVAVLGDQDGALPAALGRLLGRALRAAGYRGVRAGARLSGMKRVPTPKSAVTECDRVAARLTRACDAWAAPQARRRRGV